MKADTNRLILNLKDILYIKVGFSNTESGLIRKTLCCIALIASQC